MGADDERGIVGGFRNLIVGDDVGGESSIGELAARLVGVLQTELRLNGAQSESEAFELRGVHLDPDCGSSATADKNLADAVDGRKLLLEDGGGQIVDLGDVVGLR